MSSTRIFVSYAHEDSRWFEDRSLIPYLARSLRLVGAELWFDRAGLEAGERYRRRIESEIDKSDIAILLLSQWFLSSEFVARVELPRIRARAEAGKVRAVPVLLDPCHWERDAFIRTLNIVPDGARPLITFRAAEHEWSQVCYDILCHLERLLPQHADALPALRDTPAPDPPAELYPSPSSLGWGPDDQPYPGWVYTHPSSGVGLVWIPPGSLDMGADDITAHEKPMHRVTITKGFWLGMYAVTNGQYLEYCCAAGPDFPAGSNQPDAHPVVSVSWDDAQAYCEHYALRLPTEAEWEWAARGERGLTYPWGDHWDATLCCNLGNQGPYEATCSVGRFRMGASWCEASDMAGNVWEWCQDWDGPYPDHPVRDPRGPAAGIERVLRGGSWVTQPHVCRSAYRYSCNPLVRNYDLGFRVAASNPF